MEHVINAIAMCLAAFLGVYFEKRHNKKKYANIEERVFRDLGDKVEVTTSLGSWISKPKVICVRKGSVVTIQQAGIVSLFLDSRGIIDLFYSSVNPGSVAKVAARYFPEAEFVRIP